MHYYEYNLNNVSTNNQQYCRIISFLCKNGIICNKLLYKYIRLNKLWDTNSACAFSIRLFIAVFLSNIIYYCVFIIYTYLLTYSVPPQTFLFTIYTTIRVYFRIIIYTVIYRCFHNNAYRSRRSSDRIIIKYIFMG